MSLWLNKLKRKHDDICQRRIEVSKLFAEGMTQKEIGNKLGVSVYAVNTDIKALREQWREESLFQMQEYVGAELMRLDHMQRVAWEEFHNSGYQKIVKTAPNGSTQTEEIHKPKDVQLLKFLYDVIVLRGKICGTFHTKYCDIGKSSGVSIESNGKKEAKEAIAEMSQFIQSSGFAYKDDEIEEAQASDSISVNQT